MDNVSEEELTRILKEYNASNLNELNWLLGRIIHEGLGY